MNRRQLIGASLGAAAAFGLSRPGTAAAAGVDVAQPLPSRSRVRVAFMIGRNTNVIDTAGPWEVFQDAKLADGREPFQLFTVAPEQGTVRMTGGLKVVPDYTIEDAPQPHVIVVPAQRATDPARAWLRQAATGADLVMSVCTGAFELARTGLLDGLVATTHHQFWEEFESEFPQVTLDRGPRFVDNGQIATSGGLISGIDLALHVVGRYFGEDVAAATARLMEYRRRT